MKYILFILFIAVAFSSCAICPHGGGPVNEQRVRKHDRKPFTVMQWTKQRSDGYYIVHTIKSNRTRRYNVFECKPDSAQLARL